MHQATWTCAPRHRRYVTCSCFCSSSCLLYGSSHTAQHVVILQAGPREPLVDWGPGASSLGRVQSSRPSRRAVRAVCVGFVALTCLLPFVPLCCGLCLASLDRRRGVTIRIQDTPARRPRLSPVTDWGYMQVEVDEMDWRVLFLCIRRSFHDLRLGYLLFCAVVYLLSAASSLNVSYWAY